MRIDDLIIDENKTVLDAMHQLNDTAAPHRAGATRLSWCWAS